MLIDYSFMVPVSYIKELMKFMKKMKIYKTGYEYTKS